jgi:DNA-binding NtrC family response regulator
VPTLAVLPAEAPQLLPEASSAVDDFVVWPLRQGELRQRLLRLVGTGSDPDAMRRRLMTDLGLAQLVGEDPAFVRVMEKIPALSRCDGPILITGETGTGKELCARAVHHLGKRSRFPFIPVDCGAIPDHLFENELYGHARGAFTDAREEQRGLAAMAEGGTLFLDEIDSLSLAAQGKLLRFIQELTYRPLGAERFVKANLGVVAASNRDVERCVRERVLRADLYFRLNVLRLHLPPLRERPADIERLARHFLDSLGERTGARKTVSPAAMAKLAQHDWPGNVRELFNVLQRGQAFSRGPQILPHDLALGGEPTADAPPPVIAGLLQSPFRRARAQAVAAFERAYVEEALRHHHGNVTRAALAAHKDRRAFGRLVKKYSIDRNAS